MNKYLKIEKFNNSFFIDLEYCEKLFFYYKKEIIIKLIMSNKIIMINLPLFSEYYLDIFSKFLDKFLYKYKERIIFVANDLGTMNILDLKNFNYYVGRILKRIFGEIKKDNLIYKNIKGFIYDSIDIPREEKLRKIYINYNILLGISSNCKYDICNIKCIKGKEIFGLNKKFFLIGKNLYMKI